MKSTTLLVILFTAFTSFSQNLQFNRETYSWSQTPPTFTPSESDKKSATVYVFLNKTVEYVMDAKGESVDMYYVSHHLKFVNDDKSVEDNNKIYVSTSERQNLLYIKVRVVEKGKVIFEASEKDFIQVEEDEKKYNMIALKGLAKGALVETIVGYKLDAELYGYETFQMGYPVKKAEYQLITPGVLKFNSKVYNGSGTSIDTVYEDRRFSSILFKDVPAVDDEEKYTLTSANKLRVEYVYAQHMESKKKYLKWPEMGRIFFDRMNKNYEKNEKDLDKILSKVNIKQCKTDEEKIFAIENYLKNNIGSEVNAPDVETFAEVIKMKYTYPYKLNQMFVQLYRKAGVPCELVLTCEKEYKRFDPDFDSWTYLKNMILFFPTVNKFVDPQATLYRLGQTSTDYLGQQGLFIKYVTIGDVVSASASVKTIPANQPEKTHDVENYTVSIAKDQASSTVEYHREMNGYAEQGMRGVYYIVDEAKRKEIMDDFVKGLATDGKVSNMQVLNYDITKRENTNLPLIIKANISTTHYIESAGDDKFLFKVGELIGQQMEMYQTTPRITPVDIAFAHNYQRTITINIPQGYKLKGLDKLNISHAYNNAQGKPSFGFVSSYVLTSDKLVITCNEYYNDLTYPVSQFEQYKEVINDAADFNKISILFEKE
jgi:hypothetical protein